VRADVRTGLDNVYWYVRRHELAMAQGVGQRPDESLAGIIGGGTPRLDGVVLGTADGRSMYLPDDLLQWKVAAPLNIGG